MVFILTLNVFYATAQPANKEISAVLNPFVESKELPGMVTIVAKGEKIYSINCAGYQNIAQKKMMGPGALFWIASQGKPIAATAVMMLVDDGKLSLDEPITTYLPELKKLMIVREKTGSGQVVSPAKTPITLRHLLSHTSGMKWVAGVQEQMGHIDVLPFNISLYVSAMTPCDAEPGERYSYSNQGINIAATIIERVSGMSYYQFLKKRIFNPLGMNSATFWPTKKQLATLVTPYKKGANGELAETEIDQLQYPLTDTVHRFAEAAGGLFCSPLDLLKFYQMLAGKGVYKGKRYLNAASVTAMETKQTKTDIKDSYGLGLAVNDLYAGHAGAYGTDTRIYKENGFVVMYFVQENGLDKNGDAQQGFYKKASELFNIEP